MSDQMDQISYHGTNAERAERILARGFSEVDETWLNPNGPCGVVLTLTPAPWVRKCPGVTVLQVIFPLPFSDSAGHIDPEDGGLLFVVPAHWCRHRQVVVRIAGRMPA